MSDKAQQKRNARIRRHRRDVSRFEELRLVRVSRFTARIVISALKLLMTLPVALWPQHRQLKLVLLLVARAMFRLPPPLAKFWPNAPRLPV